MHSPLRLLSLALFVATFNGVAETVKDREGAVRKDRTTMEVDARWIYNDFERGFAEAKRTGKPLLVVLRCVPCLACAGIDAQVLLQETELTPLLDQFVGVRLINANTLDLARFQFDYDLSFSTLFFNGDGTVYGRYGSWKHQRDTQDATTAGYKAALEGALAIHRGYPANKAALAGKQGGPTPFKMPVEIPVLAGRYPRELDWQGKVVQSCVHCHQIGDAFRTAVREKGERMPLDLIYPQPSPETIGLTLAPDQAARIESVAVGSVSAAAGLLPGDDLLSLADQALISSADFSWVLHRAPESGKLAAVVVRSGVKKALAINLLEGWRTRTDISKRVGVWPMRGMATGGMVLEELPDEDRTQRGIEKDKLALYVKGVGKFGKHAAAKNAGVNAEDVLVEIAGVSNRMTEGELIGHLLTRHQAGEVVSATVLRGQKRVEIKLPMQ